MKNDRICRIHLDPGSDKRVGSRAFHGMSNPRNALTVAIATAILDRTILEMRGREKKISFLWIGNGRRWRQENRLVILDTDGGYRLAW